jgi:hypothetical protein
MGQAATMEPLHKRRGPYPRGLAAEYEKWMVDLEAAISPDTDGPAEREKKAAISAAAMDGADAEWKRYQLRLSNSEMFSLLETIEKEAHQWQHRFERQSGMHLQHQASMEEEIARAQLEFGGFMGALNSVRMERKDPKINNVTELRKLYEEVVK